MYEDDRCIKQPDNMGICCKDEVKHCEKCGWNPEYLEKLRRKNKNKNKGDG